MNKEKLIVWGTGQLSDMVCWYLRRDTPYEICAFCMDQAYIQEATHDGLPVVPFEDLEKHYPPAEYKMSLPISFRKLNRIREDRFLRAKEKGYTCISYISSRASCEAQSIGENVFVLDMAVINPFARLGNNIVIWSGTHIGHHSTVEDHCFIANAKVAGCVRVERNCFLGVGSVVCDTLVVGHHSIIGGGVVVTKDVKEASVLATRQVAPLPLESYDAEDMLT